MIFQSEAILQIHGNRNDFWLTAHADEGLGKYYLHITQKALRAKYDIMKPKWGAHLSIVRGATGISLSIANSLHQKPIAFTYDHEVYRVNRHFCLNVWCEEAERIRQSIGLPATPHIPFHLTIGVINPSNE